MGRIGQNKSVKQKEECLDGENPSINGVLKSFYSDSFCLFS